MPSDQTTRLIAKKSTESIWILGGGAFGKRAADSILQHNPSVRITLVDVQPSSEFPAVITVIQEDAVSWLDEHLSPSSRVDKIIPAVPLHLAAEWLLRKMAADNFTVEAVELENAYLQALPHPLRQSVSQVTISHADFLCPPHCNEPEDICTYTKRPRPTPLYQLLRDHNFHPFICHIIRSRQFAPGVGGFYPQDLWNIYKNIVSLPNTPLLLATACKCHGIIDAFTLRSTQ